jgi:hypothetical protein
MNTDYVKLPIGKISKDELKPWLQWFGKKECSFFSFPNITEFFSEVNPEVEAKNIDYFQEGDLVEPDSFLEENLLFYVNITLYYVIHSSVKMLVKFSCDGTAEIDKIYLDDDESNDLIKENIKNIDVVIEQKSNTKKLSWKDFVQLFEEIEKGVYNKKLEIPEF